MFLEIVIFLQENARDPDTFSHVVIPGNCFLFVLLAFRQIFVIHCLQKFFSDEYVVPGAYCLIVLFREFQESSLQFLLQAVHGLLL